MVIANMTATIATVTGTAVAMATATMTAAAVVVEATATIAAPDTAKAATDSCRPGRPHAAGTAWRIIGRLFEGSAPP